MTTRPGAQYEHANLTTMQAVARLTVCLRSARLSCRPTRLQIVASRLLEASRLACMLGEEGLQHTVARVHQGVMDSEQIDVKALRSQCAGLEDAWNELLRENNTRYLPTS